MSYKIILKNPAERFLKKLSKEFQREIVKKIRKLEDNLRLGKPLVGNLSGLWSLRIGKYRIVYQIKHNLSIIFILNIGHRKNIY